MMRSMSAGVSPARRAPPRAARVASVEVVSPSAAIWRCRMPVRCTIHSSEVSTDRRQFGVGDDALGQAGADAAHDRTKSCSVHEGAFPKGLRFKVTAGAAVGARASLAWRDHVADLAEQFLAHHVVADLDRAGEALGVRPAMTLDDDAVKAEKHAAVDPAGVHLVAQRAKGVAREPDSRAATASCAFIASRMYWRDLLGGALGGLQRDIAGEALGDEDVDRALAEIVALDEAVIAEVAASSVSRSTRPAALTSSMPLISSTPTLSRPTRRACRCRTRCAPSPRP